MSRKFLICLLGFILVSCSPQPTPQAPVPDQDLISTLVAATLEARSPGDAAPESTQQPAQPTDPAEPTSIPSETPTLTPTLTPTSTPTSTPTPTPTDVPGDPAQELGSATWKDSFDTKDNWNGFEDNQSKFVIKDGAFYLTAKKANSFEAWTISWPAIKNFYLEYTGVFGEECAGKDRYGMIFRTPNFSEGYLFGISCDGSYRLSAWDGEEYTVLKSWTKSSHIKAGPDQENRFGIKAKGERLTGYVNGQEVFSITVDMYNAKGKFGVFAAASDTPGFTAKVTRVRYWELP